MGNKLELTWYGKEKEIKVEPRILIEDKEKSNIKNDPNTENMLIHGDNLIALKAIENKYAGQIKCIYIDPPYNIAAANPYYDDNLENSEWLNLIRPRIEILWNLLSEDGLLAVQIDDEQFARLFLLMTEICGQSNMKIVCVKMSEATGVKMASVNRAKSIAKLKEFIILGKKDGIRNLYIEKIPKDKWDEEYKIWVEGVTKEELEELKDKQSKLEANFNNAIDNLMNTNGVNGIISALQELDRSLEILQKQGKEESEVRSRQRQEKLELAFDSPKFKEAVGDLVKEVYSERKKVKSGIDDIEKERSNYAKLRTTYEKEKNKGLDIKGYYKIKDMMETIDKETPNFKNAYPKMYKEVNQTLEKTKEKILDKTKNKENDRSREL